MRLPRVGLLAAVLLASIGIVQPSSAAAADPGPPSAPTDLETARASLAIDLQWSAPIDDGGAPITAYRIYRNGEMVHQSDGTTLAHHDAGLTEGSAHEYEVTAVNEFGEGEPSESILGRTEGDDEDPPTVTFVSPVDRSTVGHDTPLTADFSCADVMSGVRTCTATMEHASADGIVVTDGGALDTSVLGVHLITVTPRDWAYNSDTISFWYIVADQTDPTVTITSPADGTKVLRGTPLVADFACADEPDASAGLATCIGDVADGTTIDTSLPGPRTFTVTATDDWDNETTTTVTFDVVNPTCQGEPVTVWLATGDEPTDGADVILGTHGPDVIAPGGGHDLVCALQGDDTVAPSTGTDRLYLGVGDDEARAGVGADTLYGGPGEDRLDGGLGPDRLLGDHGTDDCRGGPGRDSANWCEVLVAVP